ncbi:hypothetical protein G5B30_04335 [Sphingobacterium sp. SGG-5]|uniref:hypothetical protein n=1 Tax=Sphingobacterium sp. SGG-5 TaxID=2710881 RepID=UPI0013ECE5AD|nr:hypothetical protein [Sphingobacterium sp. SGG-5]NGM61143.1 hypothetical protein [Sphingobacterium sp. SGG-5]
MLNDIDKVKELLSKIEVVEIIKKIEIYRKLDFKTISDQDLFNEILKVILVNVNGVDRSFLFPRLASYPHKTKFYRVRAVESDDHYCPLKAMTFEQDAWNPPSEFIKKRGRLNNIHESLLYTSPINPFVAVEEIKVKDGEWFCLIVYEAKVEIKVSIIGQWEDLPELSADENLKMRIISNFLNDEFTRDVGEGTEYLYRASERIAKDYFDLPPRIVQDAWCYPSIAQKNCANVCFRPEIAKDVLKLVGVQICKITKENGDYLFTCPVIATGFDDDKKFKYYSVDHPICKEIFPEIQLGKNTG